MMILVFLFLFQVIMQLLVQMGMVVMQVQPISLSVAALPGASRPSSQPAMRPLMIILDIGYPSLDLMQLLVPMVMRVIKVPPISLSVAALPGASSKSSQPLMEQRVMFLVLRYPSLDLMQLLVHIMMVVMVQVQPIFLIEVGLIGLNRQRLSPWMQQRVIILVTLFLFQEIMQLLVHIMMVVMVQVQPIFLIEVGLIGLNRQS